MIQKCLFPAAGYGTRFLPATKAMPKEMLPILNKPLIQYGVEEALFAGIHQIAFVTGRGKRAIEDHFDINYEMENEIRGTNKENYLDGINNIIKHCTFSYTRQIIISGLGQAILTGETLIGNEPFGVILADDLCISDGKHDLMKQMIELYTKYNCCIVALQEVNQEEVGKYGIVSGKKNRDGTITIKNMVEKPDPKDAPSNFAIIGRYILQPKIFEILKKIKPGVGGEIQITDALRNLTETENVIGLVFKGLRFDCGSVDGFVKATNYFYEKHA